MRPEAAAIAQWRREPWVYVRQVLRAEPDPWQDEVLHEVGDTIARDAAMRLALKGAKGVAKSTLLAFLLWWRQTCFLFHKGAATSISGDNLADGLWTEMAKWRQNSRLLQATFEFTEDRIFARQHPDLWFLSARKWPRRSDATAQADTLAGIHADHATLAADESGGIPRSVMAAADPVLANASVEHDRTALVCQAGNPTTLDGPLYDACTRERALWFVYEVNGDPDNPKRSPRVSVKWAREQIAKYGRDNPWVLVNVFGLFPPGSSNALINVDDVSAAMSREIPRTEWEQEPKVMGIDVAREGDDRSVFFLRQGFLARRPQVFRIADTMQLADLAARFIIENEPDGVFIDEAGFGAGVLDRLRQLGHRVLGVKFGAPALKAEYANRRSEMWHGMAKWVPRACLPEMGELVQELTAPTYGIGENGKLLLEKKKDIKARIGVSPDLADALALTFAAPVAHKKLRELQERTARARQQRPFDPFSRLGVP